MEPERPYHHGSLREAALQAARTTVEERGHHALSMRELAAQIGVVPSALYRHYRSRSELLSALTNEAHAALRVEFDRAVLEHPDPWDALAASGRAFLTFTDNHRRLFLMMYDDEVINTPESEDHLPMLADNYGFLLQLTRQALPHLSLHEARLRILGMWSALFGFAKVRSHGVLKSYMTIGLSPQAMQDAMLTTALGERPRAGARDTHP
jgi:AcrR family transcriptional regulator